MLPTHIVCGVEVLERVLRCQARVQRRVPRGNALLLFASKTRGYTIRVCPPLYVALVTIEQSVDRITIVIQACSCV